MGMIDIKIRKTTGAPWRIVFTFYTEAERALCQDVEHGLMGSNAFTFPLEHTTFAKLRNIFPTATITDRAMRWYEQYKLTVTEAAHVKVKQGENVGLDIPFNDKLYNFQRIGAQWLLTVRRGILADDPGLGKTVTSLAAAESIKAKRVLVITLPGTLQFQWRDVIRRWTDKTASVVAGNKYEKMNAFKRQATYYVISYNILGDRKVDNVPHNDYHHWLFNVPWDCIIMDEAHSIQARDSARSKGAKRLRAPYVFMLTGTPIFNKAGSIWSLLNMLDAARFSSYWNFVEKYCQIVMRPFGREVKDVMEEKISELRTLLSPYVLRRESTDVSNELPDVVFDTIRYSLPHDFHKIFAMVKKGRVEYQDVSFDCFASAQRISTLRKLCTTPKVYGFKFPSPKDEELLQLVNTHRPCGRRILIFTWFRDSCAHVRNLLHRNNKEDKIAVIHGQVPQEERGFIMQAIKDNNVDILIATISSLGVGIDLPMFDVCIFVESDWTPAVVEQSWRRIYRLGSTGGRFVYFLIARNSIEERIHTVTDKKQIVTEELLLSDFDPEN